MSWVLLSLLTAICATVHDLLVRSLVRDGALSSRLVMGSSCLLASVLALPLALLLAPVPQWRPLLEALLATGAINGVAFWAYGRALARGDLSQVLPLINLSPVVLLLSGWVVLGERPGGVATLGVLLVVAGALMLGWSGGSGGAPGGGWLGLWRAPGARPMLLVAVLWGLGASVDKLGVRAGGSLTWLTGLHLAVGLPLLLPALAAGEGAALVPGRQGPAGAARPVLLLLLAVVVVLASVCQFEALQRTAVVHVVAIKRLSTLLSAVVGVVWLGEYSGSLRLPAAGIMVAGAVLVLARGTG